MLHEPDLLFLDEPTAGLDPEAAIDLIGYVREMVRTARTTVVICTHQLHGLETLCDDVGILDQGRLVVTGEVQAVLRRRWPEHRYLLEVEGDPASAREVIAPLVIVPLVFVVLIPGAVLLLGSSPALLTTTVAGLSGFIENLPVHALPAGYSAEQLTVYAIIVYFMAPLFLLIPVMVASLTASSSFVGEKERGTIEGLLYTPLTDRELVLGKVLASVIPAVLLTWASFLVYAVLVNALGAPLMGGVFFPTWAWAIVIVALAPLVAFLATCLIVAISGRSTTMQGAQGSVVLIVLPVLALIAGQSTGLMLFDARIASVAAVTLLVIDVAVFRTVAGRFRREPIITRL
ncbi:ABC transporter permease subunit [Nonomuraea candida]|uniref:ABC transporter permease subunit n=1 Tax=Nonomuraea candida TaxID=359159 RepID=UPI00069358ED|nr:ABC transporter permease subunit [Nonomuraea candida]